MMPLETIAKAYDTTVPDMLKAQALTLLCPELLPRITDGSLTLDAAQEEVGKAFGKMVMGIVMQEREVERRIAEEASA